MELILINGSNNQYCQHLAQKLRVAGFQHFDASMYFIEDTGHVHYNATKILEARDWCKREVLKAVSRGKSVVVSSQGISPQDLRAYRAINCITNTLNIDEMTHAQIVERIQHHIEDKQSRSRWAYVGFRFMNFLRA